MTLTGIVRRNVGRAKIAGTGRSTHYDAKKNAATRNPIQKRAVGESHGAAESK